jgi:hypothetical protein
MVAAIHNQEAQTEARSVFENWLCKCGIPGQIQGRHITRLLKYFIKYLNAAMAIHLIKEESSCQGNISVKIVTYIIANIVTAIFQLATFSKSNVTIMLLITQMMI